MDHISIGVFIKAKRKEKDYSLKYFCETVCNGGLTESELSRIENGKRNPHWGTFELILKMLGEEEFLKYCTAFVSVKDKRVIDLKDKLRHMLRLRNEVANNEAEILIRELEQDDSTEYAVNRFFLYGMKATLAFYRKDIEGAYQHAINAMTAIKPNFSEADIDTYILSSDECHVIIQLAVLQSSLSSLEKAIEILAKLKTSIDKNYVSGHEFKDIKMRLLYNLSKWMVTEKCHDIQSLALCDEGLTLCKEYRDAFYYPMILVNKASYLLYQKSTEDGVRIANDAVAVLRAYDRTNEASIVVSFIHKEFGIMLSKPTTLL